MTVSRRLSRADLHVVDIDPHLRRTGEPLHPIADAAGKVAHEYETARSVLGNDFLEAAVQLLLFLLVTGGTRGGQDLVHLGIVIMPQRVVPCPAALIPR